MQKTNFPNTPSHMLDVIMQKKGLKTDAALAKALKVAAPVISKVRHNTISIGPSLLVRLHELSGMTTMEIKILAGLPPC